jgi:hypothetical protein
MVGGLARSGVALNRIRYEFFGSADELLAALGSSASIELAKKIKKGQFNLATLPGKPTTAPETWVAV